MCSFGANHFFSEPGTHSPARSPPKHCSHAQSDLSDFFGGSGESTGASAGDSAGACFGGADASAPPSLFDKALVAFSTAASSVSLTLPTASLDSAVAVSTAELMASLTLLWIASLAASFAASLAADFAAALPPQEDEGASPPRLPPRRRRLVSLHPSWSKPI